MAIPYKFRIFAVITTLSFSLPAYAQAEGIIAGLLKSYVFSMVVAFIVLVLMLLGKRTRKVLHFPILLAALPCLPLGMSILKGGGTNSMFIFAIIGGYIAPWLFVVSSTIAAFVSRGNEEVPEEALASEKRRSLWHALNLTLPLAALIIKFTHPIGFTITRLLYHFDWFRSLLRALNGVGPYFLVLALNYFFVVTVLLKIFDWIAVWRWLKPSLSGTNILLVANIIVLGFLLVPLGDQSNPTIQALRDDLTGLYFWTGMLLAFIGYLVMIKSSFSGTKSNSQLNTDAPPTGEAPVS
ncbi:MAG: hypothetical protein H6R14_2616 [Proteobacteria bacterium]|nr:hypothetical protein [Pseudomonadota bacterium]